MKVRIVTKQVTPDLMQQINTAIGHGNDLRAYNWFSLDLTDAVPASLSQALQDASIVPDSGVTVMDEPAPKPESKPSTLGEGAKRIYYHVVHNGLEPGEYNASTLADHFARHPEDDPNNPDTVDRVIFRDLEAVLSWRENHPGHLFWAEKFAPPPAPKPAPPPPKPPKVPKKLLYLPNGERRLEVPSPLEVLKEASLFQLEDYRKRGGI